MAHFSPIILALCMLGCGPTTEHESGTCRGSAGIHQAGTYIPYPSTDAGRGDASDTSTDAGISLGDAGLRATDNPTSQPNADTG